MNKKLLTIVCACLFLSKILVAQSLDSGAENDASVQAMNSYEQQYTVLMNNVVNAKTPGFKSAKVITRQLDGKLSTEVVSDRESGQLVYSGDKYHIGIDGPGYFAVETPDGIMYTRDGRFKLNQSMQLVTYSGDFLVLGESGPINLSVDSSGGISFGVSETGLIAQGDNIVDRFLIGDIKDLSKLELFNNVFFKQPLKQKKSGSGSNDNFQVDSNLFVPMENYKVRQGYYEASNVDMAQQLVNMPMISKKYDANSKVLQIKKRMIKSAMEMGKTQ